MATSIQTLRPSVAHLRKQAWKYWAALVVVLACACRSTSFRKRLRLLLSRRLPLKLTRDRQPRSDNPKLQWAPTLANGMKAGLSDECQKRLRAGLDDFVPAWRGVGPNLCVVIDNSSVSFLHQAGCEWTEDSLFRVFSMTKPVFTCAFLTLLDSGRVRLDDPVSMYIPSFKNIKVLGMQSRGRAAFIDELDFVLFAPFKAARAHAAAKAKGMMTDDGWLRLDFLVNSYAMKGHSRFGMEDAVKLLSNCTAVELQVDAHGDYWLRRHGRDFLPNFMLNEDFSDCEEPRWEITLRMLFTHSAGCGYDGTLYKTPPTVVQRAYGDLARDVQAGLVPNLAAWVERFSQIPLLFHPGEDVKYGYSFDVLGRVAEVISGMPLDEFIQRTVLTPLGMSDTSFSVSSAKLDRLVPLQRHAKCYMKHVGKGDFLDENSNSRWSEGQASVVISAGGAVELMAGGLVSTLNDYVKFLRMLLNRGVGPDGQRILSEHVITMSVDPRHVSLATGGLRQESVPGRSFSLLGEVVVSDRSPALGLASWGGTAGTFFGLHLQKQYAFVLLAQTFSAPKTKALFEDVLCSDFT